MKKLFLVLIICLIVAPVFGEDLRVPNEVESTMAVSPAWVDTDGTWQEITSPSGPNIRHMLIQVHNGTASDYTHFENKVEFQFSSASDGTGWIYADSLILSIGKNAGETLGYIKAATGQKLARLYLR